METHVVIEFPCTLAQMPCDAGWRREPAGVLVYPPGADHKAAREVLSGAAPGRGDRSRCAGCPFGPLVGPVISFGLAGLFGELFGDVATGVTPLTDRDASALLASLRAYPLRTGASGDHAADLPALEDALLRLSAGWF